MLVTKLGIVIAVKLEQLSNAELPILVTKSGIVIDVKPEQLINALVPILVIVEPIVTVARLVLPEQAPSGIAPA